MAFFLLSPARTGRRDVVKSGLIGLFQTGRVAEPANTKDFQPRAQIL
jgi:hypothetical protein